MYNKKTESRNIMRRFATVVILFVILTSVSCKNPTDRAEPKAQALQSEGEAEAASSKLQVHFIDVGQGDAALILCDGHAMLFDAGGNDKGPLLQFYLMDMGVDRLDYVIGSHPEADHIGGMDVILLKYDCGRVMLPDAAVDTTTYRDVLDAMESRGYKNTIPRVGESYQLGAASFTIIAPNRDDYGDNINNYSIGIKLVYGERSFIFTGDAEAEAEEDILKNGISVNADVLQVGHHGSHDASGQAFIEAVSPEYAVISCGKENDYGHPHAETLDTLRSAGAVVLRTDKEGNIVAVSDGKSLTWDLKPAVVWQGIYYVGNKSNGKLHVSTCHSLPKEWNQVIFGSKEEAAAAGFSDFCGECGKSYIPCSLQ